MAYQRASSSTFTAFYVVESLAFNIFKKSTDHDDLEDKLYVSRITAEFNGTHRFPFIQTLNRCFPKIAFQRHIQISVKYLRWSVLCLTGFWIHLWNWVLRSTKNHDHNFAHTNFQIFSPRLGFTFTRLGFTSLARVLSFNWFRRSSNV